MATGERDKRLRVAAVGLGWVTTHRHIPWLRKSPLVQLTGVIDRSQDPVAAAMANLPGLHSAVATGPSEVPWLDQVDAVTIGTPPPTHRALATAYLRAGKHVLLEKPMAMDGNEARALAGEANQSGHILAVVHNFQFARSMTRLRRMLDRGDLGELRGVSGMQFSNPRRRLPTWYEDLPLGLFTDESPHLLYLVRSLLGPQVRLVHSTLLPSPTGRTTPAVAALVLEANAIVATLTMHFEAPLSEWHLAVYGSERIAVVDVFRDVLVVTRNDGRHEAADIMRTSALAIRSHLSGIAGSGIRLVSGRLAYGNDVVIDRFARACLTGEPPTGIGAEDGLAVVSLQDQVRLTAQPYAA